ncbi:hypothetical protein LJR220_006145 [Bradyrhizobium sp. LjRoot220]|uniref:hypothetical protein n=1 Tax=Bradyrhizobium sp. LjRoot220 TaxID=3342284 RepID=UPI003ECE9CFE
MRYIDLDRLVLPENWLQEASDAATAVSAGGSVDQNAAIWRKLKNGLAALSNDKCWYCETPVDRSDNAVDHFRPKGRVRDAAQPHQGYRWLAYDRSNYRYACTFCNSRRKDIAAGTAGGKADRFPLVDEARRLYAPGPLHQEHPLLLDPCELYDWELIGCMQENGKPFATAANGLSRQRAEASIEIYHLQYEPTCKRRHGAAVQLMADVDQAKRLFAQSQLDSDYEIEFKVIGKKIKRAISRDAIFSGEMIFLLKGQRHSDHPWIQNLLEA